MSPKRGTIPPDLSKIQDKLREVGNILDEIFAREGLSETFTAIADFGDKLTEIQQRALRGLSEGAEFSGRALQNFTQIIQSESRRLQANLQQIYAGIVPEKFRALTEEFDNIQRRTTSFRAVGNIFANVLPGGLGAFARSLMSALGPIAALGYILYRLSNFLTGGIHTYMRTLETTTQFAGQIGLSTSRILRWNETLQAVGQRYGYGMRDILRLQQSYVRQFGALLTHSAEDIFTYTRALGMSFEELTAAFSTMYYTAFQIRGEQAVIREDIISKTITHNIQMVVAGLGTQGTIVRRVLDTANNIHRQMIEYAGVSLRTSLENITSLNTIITKLTELPPELAGRITSAIGMGIAQPRTMGIELYILRQLGWRGGLAQYLFLRGAMERPFERIPGQIRSPAETILTNIQREIRTQQLSTSTANSILRNMFNLTYSQATVLTNMLANNENISNAMNKLKQLAEERETLQTLQRRAYEILADNPYLKIKSVLENIQYNTGQGLIENRAMRWLIGKMAGVSREDMERMLIQAEALERLPRAQRIGLSPADIEKIATLYHGFIQRYPQIPPQQLEISVRKLDDVYKVFINQKTEDGRVISTRYIGEFK